MKINPISTIDRTNFGAKIVPTEPLGDAFIMVNKCINSGVTKNMNYAKGFIDSIARIKATKDIAEYRLELDETTPNHTYAYINGQLANYCITPMKGDYFAVEVTKKYSANFEKNEKSVLDVLQGQIEEARLKLSELEDKYGQCLKTEIEKLQNSIFVS